MDKSPDEFLKKSHGANWQWEFLTSDSFASFFDLIPEAGILSNEAGEIILTNQTAQRLFNYSKQEFLQRTIEDIVPPKIRKEHVRLREWFFESPQPRFLENRNLDLQACKKGGELFPMESSLFAIHTNKGTIAVNLLRDVSKQKAEQVAITQLAFIDTLTNLPNTRYFQTNLKHNAAKAKRHNQTLGILFIDLDHFKPINDNFGHNIGDHVLKQVAERLASTLREEDTLARVGGDEFIAMIYPVTNTAALESTAQRLLDACNKPIDVESKTFHVSASIGICFNHNSSFDPQTLIHTADKAMYQAKKNGGNGFICINTA